MNHTPTGESGNGRKRAALYVRTSAVNQQQSARNQEEALREYAHRHGFEVVHTYEDRGTSGVEDTGDEDPESLEQLIDEVEGGKADFDAILVCDASRWRRSQGETVEIERLLKRAGIEVHYCAEQSAACERPRGATAESGKRARAAQHSRELSSRVLRGECRIVDRGLICLPRSVIDKDRVVAVRCPPEVAQMVLRMLRLFVQAGKQASEIAEMLNSEGIRDAIDNSPKSA